jgi:hypothetical protein
MVGFLNKARRRRAMRPSWRPSATGCGSCFAEEQISPFNFAGNETGARDCRSSPPSWSGYLWVSWSRAAALEATESGTTRTQRATGVQLSLAR